MTPSLNPRTTNHPCRSILPLAASLLILLLLMPTGVFAQGTTGEIRGTVFNQETGGPMKGVTVSLFKLDGTPIMVGSYTDARGEYVIHNVPPGHYVLRAMMSSFMTAEMPELLVTVGLTTTQNFQMEKPPPTGAIRGRVTDMSGDPIAAANIMVFNLDGTATARGAFSNAAGEYLIINVPSGRYILRAVMNHYKTAEVPELLVTTDVVTIQNYRLELRSAGTTGAIRGTVTSSDTGEPIAAVNVMLLELDGTATTMGAFTNAEGEYTIINVPRGRYMLQATMVGFKTAQVVELLVSIGVTTTQNFQLEKIPPL